METDQKTQLIETETSKTALLDGEDLDDILPPSSRVKKILKWNKEREVFEIDETHKQQLKSDHIKDEAQWAEFEKLFTSLRPEDHPSKRRKSCLNGTLLFSVAVILMLGLTYVCFIILQLALFNLIMLVVMAVWLWKAGQISGAIIGRILDNGRKGPFKAFIRKIKELQWLKELQLEIQEHEEGKWIEIHLSETADDDGLVESADEDEQ